MSYQTKSKQRTRRKRSTLDQSEGQEDGSNGKSTNSNAVQAYFKSIASYSLLKPEQEFELARQVEDAHRQIMYDCCRIQYKERSARGKIQTTLPGYRVVRRACRAFPEVNQELGGIESKLIRAKRPETTDRLSEEAFEALPADRYLLLRTVSSYITTDAEFSKQYQVLADNVSRHHNAALSARNRFVRGNLRLVVSIARRYNFGKLPLIDLIQEGNIGLMKAVDRYDHLRGYRFSTYASWWIRHAITRSIADTGSTIRLPVHLSETANKLNRSRNTLTNTLGREPTAIETIEHMAGGEVTQAMLNKYLHIAANQKPLSLDTTVNDEDGRSYVDFIEDVTTINPIQLIDDEQEIHRVLSMLNDPTVIKPFEAEVLRRRFAIGQEEPETLKEIGDDAGLSRERIRQVQEQGLEKVRIKLAR